MRTLKFNVNNQLITKDPNCDFDGLVPGTEEYVRAEFIFSSEWNEYTKVVSFESIMGAEYEPQLLKDGKTCMIPAEALARRSFKLRVMGKKDKSRLTTNKIIVEQNGGRV